MAPSKELRADAEKIAEAAGEMSSEPLAYMKLAKEYAEKACDLNPLAFGVICSMLFSSSYENSRSSIADSLKGGVQQLETAAGGLVKVANTIAQVEIANAADARANRNLGFTYSEPQATGGLGVGEGAAIGAGWAGAGLSALLAKNLTIAAANGASAALAPTAIASTILWALFTPMDEDISKAWGGWEAVKTQLTNVCGGTWEDIGKTLEKHWEGDSKKAYDTWADIFKTEVTQTSEAAGKNSQALKDIVEQIHLIQNIMAAFAVISLAAIIIFSIGEKAPFVGPLFTVAKNIQGALQSAATLTSIGAVLGVAALCVGPLQELAAKVSTNFATLDVNAGGGGTSFKDIKIDWAKPNVPVPGS